MDTPIGISGKSCILKWMQKIISARAELPYPPAPSSSTGPGYISCSNCKDSQYKLGLVSKQS